MLKERYDFNELAELMAYLRSSEGCPWDRVQTHDSLKRYLIEEAYEVLEAIDALNDQDAGAPSSMHDAVKDSMLCEELGDLLLQVFFHARIAEEEGRFNIGDVVTAVSRKLVQRHTHVFGSDKADTPDEVVDNWEKIKKEEKGQKSQTDVLKSVPSNLPALMRSQKVQQKAASVGFDWDNAGDVFKKVREELDELENAYMSQKKDKISEETGDLFFSLVNLSRFLDVQSELALTAATEKFIRRFGQMEVKIMGQGKKLGGMTLQEMDEVWDQVKKEEE